MGREMTSDQDRAGLQDLVLVTGVKGQLGYDLVQELTKRGVACRGVDIEDFDLTDRAAVLGSIMKMQPRQVVHCAAWTAVDKAEEMPERVYAVNVSGTEYVAEACRALGAPMMYISTDYVFPGTGDQAYEVDDPKGALGVYGLTKWEGEEKVRAWVDRHFIVRISWVFGKNGNNFVKTMLRLGAEKESLNVVCDQIGSPTYTRDLAVLLADMLATERYGTYHATNEGLCSWAEFAQAIMTEANLPCRINPVTSDQYPVKAERPKNSRLSKRSLDEAGFRRLPEWRDALRRYIAELREDG